MIQIQLQLISRTLSLEEEREILGGLFTMTENIEKIIVKNKDNFENLVTELFDSELISNSIFF